MDRSAMDKSDQLIECSIAVAVTMSADSLTGDQVDRVALKVFKSLPPTVRTAWRKVAEEAVHL